MLAEKSWTKETGCHYLNGALSFTNFLVLVALSFFGFRHYFCGSTFCSYFYGISPFSYCLLYLSFLQITLGRIKPLKNGK